MLACAKFKIFMDNVNDACNILEDHKFGLSREYMFCFMQFRSLRAHVCLGICYWCIEN